MKTRKTGAIRIGGGSGFLNDRADAALELVERGNIDVLMMETLAERTLALLHVARRKGGKGYWESLEGRLEILLPALAKHRTKFVTNAGGAAPVECARMVARMARERGIGLKVGKPFEKVERTESGVRVTIAGGETIEAELLLVAVGRGPTTANLGYEQQGLRMERGFVPTDERLRTNLPNVYAVGDIVPGLQLAHRGFQQGIFIAEELAGLNPGVIDESGIPRVTYSDPEIASMGLTEARAKEQYGADKVRTYVYNLGGNGKSQILKTAGFVKLVSLADGPVVGIHMVGARVGELVGEAQLIYNWEAYPSEVARLVHAHPTQTEALGEAHLALAGKPLHAHS